jgi:alkanesulfonate monooxygenase SsuD/methylene tetrahydromethanopterin reductase-like flavin-dependent oxidoreductase (luciferase family)
MHSVWIGEHHFSTLGVLSCPDLALAYIAARTDRIRPAPAVTVCRCIIRSASPSNGRASIC